MNLRRSTVFIAALIGAMLIFLFSSLAIRAVGTAAQAMIQEVRRQFRANPETCRALRRQTTRAAWTSARARPAADDRPGLLVVGTPIVVGVILGPEAAAGFLMVGTIGGILMALVMNNSGGAWDNAKKYIEAGSSKDEDGKG